MDKRKLKNIFCRKYITDIPIAVGDLVDVYMRTDEQKRGRWYFPRWVLELCGASWTITIPDSSGRTMKLAFEDVWPSIAEDTFAALVRAANAELDAELSSVLN